MVDFKNEFVTKSLNKVIYLITEGLEHREEVDKDKNEVTFIFPKSEESNMISNKYNRMLQSEEVMVNLTKYMQVSREINSKIREYRKNK